MINFNADPDTRMKENILHVLGSDDTIYRVVPVNRFFEIIHSKQLVLVRPKKWEDPFEDFLSRAEFTNKKGERTGFALTRKFFGNCWTLRAECDGIWRNYASLTDGVRILTTVRNLLEVIYDKNDDSSKISSFIGKVKYKKDEDIKQFLEDDNFIGWLTDATGKNVAKTLLFKRNEFTYEQEVRLLFSDGQKKFKNQDIIKFAIEPLSLIDSILFAPKMSDHLYELYKEKLIKEGFDKTTILKSQLYTPYKIEIKPDAL